MNEVKSDSAMDYDSHRVTFASFLKMVKVSVVSIVVFLIFYYIFVVA